MGAGDGQLAQGHIVRQHCHPVGGASHRGGVYPLRQRDHKQGGRRKEHHREDAAKYYQQEPYPLIWGFFGVLHCFPLLCLRRAGQQALT